MMTETLITTIVADHAAQRDADPQQVIIDRLRADLESMGRKHGQAVRRMREAQMERDTALAESERLSALNDRLEAIVESRMPTDEREPSIFALEYLELMRAHKLIKRLYAAPDGQYAAVANRMLSMIQSMCDAADPQQSRRRIA